MTAGGNYQRSPAGEARVKNEREWHKDNFWEWLKDGTYTADAIYSRYLIHLGLEKPQAEEAEFDLGVLDLEAEDPPTRYWDERKFYVREPEGTTIATYGAKGVLKTWYELHSLIEIAFANEEAMIFYYCAEGGARIARERIRLLCQAQGKTVGDLLRTGRFKITTLITAITKPRDVVRHLEALRAHKPNIIVFDTHGRATLGVSKNGDDDAGVMFAAYEMFRKVFNACVVIVAHEGKDTSKGMKGTSEFPQLCLVGQKIEAQKTKDHRPLSITVSEEHTKYGECQKPITFAVASNELGFWLTPRTGTVAENPFDAVVCPSKKLTEAQARFTVLEDSVVAILREDGAHAKSSAMLQKTLAERLVGKGLGLDRFPTEPDKLAEFDSAVDRQSDELTAGVIIKHGKPGPLVKYALALRKGRGKTTDHRLWRVPLNEKGN